VILSYSVWPSEHRWCVWADGDLAHDAPNLFREFDRSVEIIAHQINRATRSAAATGSLRDRISRIVNDIVAPASKN
jgi:hypothetical protein